MKSNDVLYYQPFMTFETRNESTFKLIHQAIGLYGIRDFDWILVNTSDRDDFDWLIAMQTTDGKIRGSDGRTYPCLSYCYSGSDAHHACPDFVYDHWRQTGLDDYEETCQRLARNTAPAQTNMLGWRGANTHSTRERLVSLNDQHKFDLEFINWDRSNPEKLSATNFLSLEEQVRKWRYLLDIEGNGYSGRLKILLRSSRVVFVQERKYREDFFQYLKPWEHYVPVRNDLSDLEENLDLIRSHPSLEAFIVRSARAFSEHYLSHNAALYRWAQLIASDTTTPTPVLP